MSALYIYHLHKRRRNLMTSLHQVLIILAPSGISLAKILLGTVFARGLTSACASLTACLITAAHFCMAQGQRETLGAEAIIISTDVEYEVINSEVTKNGGTVRDAGLSFSFHVKTDYRSCNILHRDATVNCHYHCNVSKRGIFKQSQKF